MTSDNPTPPPARRSSAVAWTIAAAALVVLGLAVVVAWISLRPKPPAPSPIDEVQDSAFPPDPRLSYAGPFRNVRPDVKHVGDGKCIDCHKDVHRTYSHHPMGRASAPAAALADRQPYDKAHNNPFKTFGIQFRVERQGDHVYHRQTRLDRDGKPIYQFAHEVDHVIGSGTRGHSYLSVRDGYVFQTPISWFSEKAIWDLSPGFPPWARAGRLVTGACLYCHVNRVEPVEHTRNRYHEPIIRGHAIGCERCHGPGELHVQTSKKDDVVNPKRLEPKLREAVCQQCHLQGATRVLRRGRGLNDYRPGLPLEEFWTVYVRGPGKGDENKAVSHVEQMHQSLCYQRSPADNKLTCTSCHDPHEAVAPERRVAHYHRRCLTCHQEHGCTMPEKARRKKNADDSCIACHVPRSGTSDVAHVAGSDHRIIRMPGQAPANRPAGRPNLPLLDFHRGAPNLDDRGQGRDLAVALYQLALGGVPLSGADGEFAVGLLSDALRDCPGDLDAWEAKGKILQTIERPGAAAEAFEALLKRAPRHEGALVSLGSIYRDLGRRAEALPYWRRAVEVNPYVAEYQKNLAFHLADRGAWEELRPVCRKWLELDPASVEARQVWVRCLLKLGQKAEAKAEFAKLRALRPPELDKLEAWFAEQAR